MSHKRTRKTGPQHPTSKRPPAGTAIPMSATDEHLKEVGRQAVHEALDERMAALEQDADRWDRQFKADALSGKLDRLADQALQDLRQGKVKDL